MKKIIMFNLFPLLLVILLNTKLFAKERMGDMGILLVPVGKIDKEVMDWLKNDLNKLLKKQVWIGEGCPNQIVPIIIKENSIYPQRY